MQKIYCPIYIYAPSVSYCIANNREILFAVPVSTFLIQIQREAGMTDPNIHKWKKIESKSSHNRIVKQLYER